MPLRAERLFHGIFERDYFMGFLREQQETTDIVNVC